MASTSSGVPGRSLLNSNVSDAVLRSGFSATGDATGTVSAPVSRLFGPQSAAQSGTTKQPAPRGEAVFASPLFVERIMPPKGKRLSSQRRRPHTREAHSLDTYKQLATSENLTIAQEMKQNPSPVDKYREKLRLHAILLDTLHQIFMDRGEPYYNESRASDWYRVHNCQAEWIGYRADCCHPYTRPIAVPIGCNHRLCPLCNSHRSQTGRERVEKLFPELKHPHLITLTIPNLPHIAKKDFGTFRDKLKTFIRQYESVFPGGLYSLETTYNWQEKTWHVHVHMLAEMAYALPQRNDRVEYNGTAYPTLGIQARGTVRGSKLFRLAKLKMEFAWVRLWMPDTWGKRPRLRKDGKRKPDTQFHEWLEACEQNRVREWSCGAYRDVLLPREIRNRRELWNRENRRVVDIRPAKDATGAAHEVLKYITKVSAFSNDPAAVEEFLTAVKGARMVQTFGTWYGVKLTEDVNEAPDWSHMQCTCGQNVWVKIGTLFRGQVQMQPDGRWVVKHEHEQDVGRAGPYRKDEYQIN